MADSHCVLFSKHLEFAAIEHGANAIKLFPAEQLKTMNMAITQITSAGISRLGVSMAAGVLLMLPPLVVFLLTQNSIIETMAFSGIKE